MHIYVCVWKWNNKLTSNNTTTPKPNCAQNRSRYDSRNRDDSGRDADTGGLLWVRDCPILSLRERERES